MLYIYSKSREFRTHVSQATLKDMDKTGPYKTTT